MTLQVKKGEKEPIQVLIRRFQKSMQQSGILVRARKRRFHSRKKSATAKKKAAMRREELRQEYAELKKLGKL